MEYTQRQIKDLLSMISAGNMPNKNRAYETTNRGLHRSISAYGIVGKIRIMKEMGQVVWIRINWANCQKIKLVVMASDLGKLSFKTA